MGLISRYSRSILMAAPLLVAAAPWAPAAPGATCPVSTPVLTGPAGVQAGISYSLSWTNVLTDLTASSANYYIVERALDSAFSSGLDQAITQRSAITLSPGAASAKVLYHRIVVKSSCPTAQPAAIVSNTVAVPVKTVCDVPPPVGEPSANPANPPAFSTWVVTWDTLGTGAGPGGGPTGLKFRIRQTSPSAPDPSEWGVGGGRAPLPGPPGTPPPRGGPGAPWGWGGPGPPPLYGKGGGRPLAPAP